MELRSLGKYRLVSPLPSDGLGGRGERASSSGTAGTLAPEGSWFLARDEEEPETGSARYVAKLMPPARSEHGRRLRARFDHETRLLQAFNHPSIVTLHAFGEQDGIAYMVMDRVDGVSLAMLLDHDGDEPRAMSKEIAVYVMGQLADALRYIHGLEYLDDDGPTPLQVVHRGICPRNIMLSRNGDALLCGFDVATSRWLEPDDDDPMAGDLAYMAPERLGPDGRATESTDLFAMAVVLWEMLKGQRCLAGASDEETRDNLVRFDIGQSNRRVSGLSPKLSEIVRKNLDRDPGRRYSGAHQMLQRLAQAPEAQSAEASRVELGKMVSAIAGDPPAPR